MENRLSYNWVSLNKPFHFKLKLVSMLLATASDLGVVINFNEWKTFLQRGSLFYIIVYCIYNLEF